MVVSASRLSRTGEGDGTLNLRGMATVLSLAAYLKGGCYCHTHASCLFSCTSHSGYSLWAKDLVFVISDGYLDGMQAWITSYHGVTQSSKSIIVDRMPRCDRYIFPTMGHCIDDDPPFSDLVAEPLQLSSGVIWTALNIDYPGHSFSHLGVFFGVHAL